MISQAYPCPNACGTNTAWGEDQPHRTHSRKRLLRIFYPTFVTLALSAVDFFPHLFALTRQIFPEASSATSNEPSVQTATPAGRP